MKQFWNQCSTGVLRNSADIIFVIIELCKKSALKYVLCLGPLKSAGHTATLVTNKQKKNERMVIIFGHSPVYGYLNTVQEYYFGK